MPEPVRLVVGYIEVFFLYFGVLVVPLLSARQKSCSVRGNDAIGTAADAVIAHEGEAKCFTCW